MVFIIQNHFMLILYNEKDLGTHLVMRYFPSMRNEQKYPITVIKL